MTHLARIKDRCRIDEFTECWLWTGGKSEGKHPRVYAPDYTACEGEMNTQTGMRAVWHAHTGKPIPKGWRVYHAMCKTHECLNPDHLACGPTSAWGKNLAAGGTWKGQPARIQANRAIGRARSVIKPGMALEIQQSDESGIAIAARLGISDAVVSNVRRGKLKAVLASGNPFAALIN